VSKIERCYELYNMYRMTSYVYGVVVITVIIMPCNNLQITLDDWSSVTKFRSLIKKTDLSDYLISNYMVTFITPWPVCCLLICS